MSGTDFVTMLVDMGFSKEKAEKGLSMTGNKGVEAAMEWIFNNPDNPEPSSSKSSSEGGTTQDSNTDSNTANQTAKSLKCDECGKLFKDQDQVEFHASKTGHSAFSESTEEKKSLTDEEKREQMKKIEEVLKQRRLEREEKEKSEALIKEKTRIQSGKEIVEAKRRMEELEMKKIVEQRKREKEEEKKAKERVKKLIEADKLARKGIQPESVAKAPETVAPTPLSTTPKEYTHSKIQIRLTNGNVLGATFDIKEPFAAVRTFVDVNRTDGAGPFSLMTTYPRKLFEEEDWPKSLKELNLVPSAVLIVKNSQA